MCHSQKIPISAGFPKIVRILLEFLVTLNLSEMTIELAITTLVDITFNGH